MRDVVSIIELGKSHGPYRLHQEVAAATQSLPYPSQAAVAAHMAAPLSAADFGDSVSTVSRVSGVPGAFGVPGVSGVPEKPGASGVSGVPDVAPGSKSSTPPGTLNWSTSTALEVALQVIGALQMMDSQNFTSCHQSKPL